MAPILDTVETCGNGQYEPEPMAGAKPPIIALTATDTMFTDTLIDNHTLFFDTQPDHTPTMATQDPLYPINNLEYYLALHTSFEPTDLAVPNSYKEATNINNNTIWRPAIDKEVAKCKTNNVFKPITNHGIIKDQKLLSTKWTFKRDMQTQQPKARVCILGNHQRPGIDFNPNETYSPVAAIAVCRSLIAYAVSAGWFLFHADVSGAFLHADVPQRKASIYVRVPDGFPRLTETGETILAFLLLKSLYGLVEAARWWHDFLKNLLISYGFTQSPTDPCLFTRDLGTPKAIITTVIVDDFLATAMHSQTVTEFHAQISRDVTLSKDEQLQFYIGIGIHIDRVKHSVTMEQQLYIMEILRRAGMSDCKGAETPSTLDELIPCPIGEELSPEDKLFVQTYVGAAMHVYVCTKPELGYALSQLSKFVSSPGPQHLTAIKQVLRYLQNTKHLALKYSKPRNNTLLNRVFVFSDANWGGTHTDRHSMGGGGAYMHGALIQWICKRLPTIMLSSAESEYCQATIITCMALYHRNIARDMNFAQHGPTDFFEDNQSTMMIATNPISSPRTRHIDIKWHFIREQILRGTIIMHYMPTTDMIADIFTKPLGRVLFIRFRNIITGATPFENEILKACSDVPRLAPVTFICTA